MNVIDGQAGQIICASLIFYSLTVDNILNIIVLLILAGVTLTMVLGENGLINKAQSSVDKYKESANNEQALLNNIKDYSEQYGWQDKELPDNSPTIPAGTQVKLPSQWPEQIVTAVSDGKGNTFPLPKNFYYVGGDYTNGVIISDEEADAYDGILNKTTWEYTTNLEGNQFVWIPCNPGEYVKTSWGSSYVVGGYDSKIGTGADLMQIAKYGGFYVARYEAGLADTIKEYEGTQLSSGYNSPGYNVSGIPKSKAGALPWIFISYTNMQNNAKNMYSNNEKYKDYVEGGVINGTQWDVMLNKFIGTKNQSGLKFTLADITNSSKWGNHYDNSISYTGRSATSYVSNSNWYIRPWSATKTNASTGKYSYTEFTTGASKTAEAYHTYDVAGNVWEWTDEIGQSSQYRVMRGGGFLLDSSSYPACYRWCNQFNYSTMWANVGFRMVLYIKLS